MENLSGIHAQFATGLGVEGLREIVLQAKKSTLNLLEGALAGFFTERGKIANNRVAEWHPS